MRYSGYEVGMTLRSLRKEKEITIERMSEETGISTSAIKQYERGGRSLSINSLFVLIDYFEVDANTILNVNKSENVNLIDTRLKELESNQRAYLESSFLYMLDHMNVMVS